MGSPPYLFICKKNANNYFYFTSRSITLMRKNTYQKDISFRTVRHSLIFRHNKVEPLEECRFENRYSCV